MYVSRIEMTGFKSFADRTIVEMEPGIFAIVGPNGCGKTNICDAIRWVLGEENVRMLRGSRIEDVIFAGTELRKPTGMAEVSLTVSDVQDVLPVEQSEVTITRRVFRSGESQFFINKVPSRLKDIVDLFLGTGMGRRAYSIMEREMVDSILDDSSGQRRKIVEEAAGISKYKVRRKETVNKLELTQRDLERVEDLISEVERRVKHLSRQAAKARRYERLTKRIKEVEVYSAVKEHHSIILRREEVDRELEAVGVNLSGLAKEISVAEAEIERMKLETVEVDSQITERGKEAASVTAKLQDADSRKIVVQERKRAIAEKLEELAAVREQKQSMLAERVGHLKARREELVAGSERLRGLLKAKDDIEAEYHRASDELRSRQTQSVESARQQMENMKRTIDAASAMSELRSKRAHLVEMIEKSQARLADLSSRIGEVEDEIGTVQPEIDDLKSRASTEADSVAELAKVIEELTQKIDAVREERARLGEEAARATSRHDILRELVERYEGYESGVKALMKYEGEGAGVHGVVGDIIKCTDARYEPAVVAALSDAVQYVVVEGREHAAGSVRMLKEGKKGAATMVMLDSIPKRQDAGSLEHPEEGVIGRIMDFVECQPRYRELFDYLLHDVFVVETLEHAFDLSHRSGNGYVSYVTPDGDAVFRGSIVRSGGNGHDCGVYVGRRQKVSDLAGEAEALRLLAEEQEKSFQELRAGLAELVRQKETAETVMARTRNELTDREKQLQSRVAERDSLKGSAADLEKDIAGFRAASVGVDKQLEEVASEPGGLEIPQGGLFDTPDGNSGLEARVSELQRRLESTSHDILKLQSNNEFLEKTTERIEIEIGGLKKEADEIETTLNSLASRKDGLDEEEELIGSEVKELLALLGGFEERRQQTLEKKRAIESAIEDKRKHIKAVTVKREEILSLKQDLKSEAEVLAVKSEALEQRMLEEYEIDIREIDPEGLRQSENCEEELAKLRAYLRDLGPVNLVALDEYDVEKERYDFLKTQRDDLIKARESLDEAILQINKRARREFMETFAQVRKGFQKNFETLFEGGAADLRLKYEHDPLESPIDILAQPIGKKLENISLLSGGERALTAIAFLFGVYYTRPSPFCLLDEVDAPLDDANVGRYVNLIKDLSQQTQFLMVTHNKKTMEAASCMYGVTMEEAGVSKMVSVRITREHEEEPEPSAVA